MEKEQLTWFDVKDAASSIFNILGNSKEMKFAEYVWEKLSELGFNSDSTYFIFHSFTLKNHSYENEILINDQLKLIPLKDDIIMKRVVHLPSCPTPFGTEHNLYKMVRCFIHKYVGLSEFFEKLD